MTFTILPACTAPGKKWGQGLALWGKTLTTFLLTFLFFAPAFGQAFNLDQMANGKVTPPFPVSQPPSSQWTWQNGNLNVNNAHFRESFSVPYRCDLTGLAPNTVYVLRIGIDVRVGSKWALDYFTGVQNLTPHGMFGHAAEKADPAAGINFGGTPTINDYPLPAPDYPGTTVETSSFNALPNTADLAGQPTPKQLRVYNATVAAGDITYENAASVDINAATTEAILRVRFTATSSHALIAWGGHIAAEFDWPGQSAQFINGSPYHCHIRNLLDDNGKELAKGSTDRSLKTDAVFRPAPCALTAAQTVCEGAASPLTYAYTGGATDVTNYKWVLTNNTPSPNVKIQGDNAAGDSDPAVGTVSGSSFTSVNIIPSSGSVFNTVGSFTLALTLTNAGGTSEPCTSTGTINQKATSNAGADQTVCASSPAVTLNGSVGGSATSGTWSGGTGTFNPNATTLNAVYTPSAAEIAAGSATLTLTSDDPTGPCAAASDNMTITITPNPGKPTAAVKTPLCTDATMTVEVTLPSGVTTGTVTLKQMTGGVSPITKNVSDAVSGKLTFTGLTFGKGYSVTITANNCTSAAEECGDFTGGYQTTVNNRNSTVTDQEITLNAQPRTNVIAAPNPFSDRIRFTLKSDISGQGSLELYNMLGQRVKTVFRGYVTAGQPQSIEYAVPGPQRANLIYEFRVGNAQTTGKLIGLKK